MNEKRAFTPVFGLIGVARKKLEAYKYRILVMSSKGGVGKSFVTSALATGLAMRGRKVALFDADMYGSSIPLLLGLQDAKHYANEKGEIIPVEGPLGMRVVALNFVLDSPDTPVAWRGPVVARAIVELAAKVAWGAGDYLLVDLPPGTGDATLTVMQIFPRATGAVLVTSPSVLSELIVAKVANLVRSARIRLLGVIENMSYFKCPHCGGITNVMGSMSGDRLTSKYGLAFLGKIPLDPGVNESIERGIPYLLFNTGSEAAKSVMEIVDRIISLVENKYSGCESGVASH